MIRTACFSSSAVFDRVYALGLLSIRNKVVTSSRLSESITESSAVTHRHVSESPCPIARVGVGVTLNHHLSFFL